jgi:8-oxo-dGTP diphosphatase
MIDMQDEFRIGVKAFIVDDQENLLIIKRRQDDVHKPGIWELPGGRIEVKEDPFSGLQREVKEETNLDIKIINPINVRHFTREDGQTITMIIFLCSPLSKDVSTSKEHVAYDWVKIDKAKERINEWFYPELEIFQRLFRDRI